MHFLSLAAPPNPQVTSPNAPSPAPGRRPGPVPLSRRPEDATNGDSRCGGRRGAAAAGRGCPSNRAGLRSGSEPSSEMRNDRLHAAPAGTEAPKGQRGGGEKGGPGESCGSMPSGATFRLPPETRMKDREQLFESSGLCEPYPPPPPFHMSPFEATEGIRPPSVHQPRETIWKQYARREGRHANITTL